jgi:hypothetical protein
VALSTKSGTQSATTKAPKHTAKKIKPSQVGVVMNAVWAANRVPYLHGPPGIGKSQLLQQQATSMNMAYIDIRLAMRSPSQISGIPMPIEEHGFIFARFSIPVEFPKDIDCEAEALVKQHKHLKFTNLNPKGSNGIHYCTKPEITVEALNLDHVAIIGEQTPECFTVELKDRDGKPVEGEVRYTIKGKVRAVLCFDELSAANPSVQAVCYSLINDRRMGEYIIPDGVKIVAAGNREEDNGVHHTMRQPLRNRFSHYELKVSWEDWVLWANCENIYPAIVTMIEENSGTMLFDFDPQSDEMAWPSPRSWEILSDIEYSMDQLGVTDPDLRKLAIDGTIGTTHGFTYFMYRERMMKLPKIAEIFTGKFKEKLNDRLDTTSQQYLVGLIINGLVNKKKHMISLYGDASKMLQGEHSVVYYTMANNAFSFMMLNFKPDLVAGAIKRMSVIHKLPMSPGSMPAFKEYIEKNKANIL